MDCEVAREALSARLDGEREPVPSARVDEHLDACAECRSWRDHVASQTLDLRGLAQSRPVIAPLGPFGIERPPPTHRPRLPWSRWALLFLGFAQILLAVVQATGLSVGLPSAHGVAAARHLLNESTAWTVALGVVMVVAALWRSAAAGLAAVLTAFTCVLTVYVVTDAVSGAVTATRILTHLPVVLGTVLAIIVWRRCSPPTPSPQQHVDDEITLPHNASRGRRRGHLWPTDGAA